MNVKKTGDIVQGLPRVEELLEARKPKENAILSEKEGRARIVTEDDTTRLYLVFGDGSEEEIVIPQGLNVIVEDGDQVFLGTALLTDRPTRTISCACVVSKQRRNSSWTKYSLYTVRKV